VAAYKSSDRSPVLTAYTTKDLPGGQSQQINVCQTKRIECHPAESNEACAPESISDTKNWLNWNNHLDNPNNSKDDWEAHDQSDIEQDNGIDEPDILERQDVTATANVPRQIRQTTRSKNTADKRLMKVNTMEMRRNERNMNKKNRRRQYSVTTLFMMTVREFHYEQYCWRIVSSRLWIWVEKQKFSGWNKTLSKIYQFG